jgi:hypothetical protein
VKRLSRETPAQGAEKRRRRLERERSQSRRHCLILIKKKKRFERGRSPFQSAIALQKKRKRSESSQLTSSLGMVGLYTGTRWLSRQIEGKNGANPQIRRTA